MSSVSIGGAYRRRKRAWKGIQPSSLAMLLGFAFLLFSTIGLLITAISPYRIPLLLFLALAVSYGLFAAAYAYVSIRIHWLIIFAILPFESLVIWWLQKQVLLQPQWPSVAHSEMLIRLNWSVGLACILIVASYVLVFMVTGREGKRFFRVHAEVELAAEIHRALVPMIDLCVDGFQIYGVSVPSGEVGGDLVDAFNRPEAGGWIAYLADVSGHGVSSGVLMAMLKSAIRMSLRRNNNAPKMLEEVNEVFYSLKAPNSFATFAGIACTRDSGLEVVVAGHLPILYSTEKEVQELDTPGLPIGILPQSDFHSLSLNIRPGEILAIVTDGLTEVFNTRGEELGDSYIKRTLERERNRPLDQIAATLLAQATEWGPRSDDQSLLLVRCVDSAQFSPIAEV